MLHIPHKGTRGWNCKSNMHNIINVYGMNIMLAALVRACFKMFIYDKSKEIGGNSAQAKA